MKEKEVSIKSPPIHAEAEITFLRADEGGRSLPVWSGYRSQFYYDGSNWDAVQEYATNDGVQPGETVKAFLRPIPMLIESAFTRAKSLRCGKVHMWWAVGA
jgi:translation elongation factor EF-Tu-like GTPase